MLAYAFILVTIALVCAVFSPVWADWREAERLRTAEVNATGSASLS
jgi:hypothetical protein